MKREIFSIYHPEKRKSRITFYVAMLRQIWRSLFLLLTHEYTNKH